MITVGIIATLATIAIPQYNNYVARAQVTEGVLALAHAKLVIIENQAVSGEYLRTEQLQALSNDRTEQLRSTKYLNLITTDQSSSNRQFDINLRFKNEGNINSNIRNKHLTFRLNYSTKSWSCVSEDIAQAYLPNACKSIGGSSGANPNANNGNNPNDLKDGVLDGNAGHGNN